MDSQAKSALMGTAQKSAINDSDNNRSTTQKRPAKYGENDEISCGAVVSTSDFLYFIAESVVAANLLNQGTVISPRR
ncbi:hypothetical protein MTO96_022360 [Rhipicephalus appendiculatus]